MPTSVDGDRTIWGEARSEERHGMEAVAAVVINRVFDNRWPDSVAEVCLQPKQFATWNRGDPNKPRLGGLNFADFMFRQCYAIAAMAMAGGILEDRTGGANHYCVSSIVERVSWARGQTETCRIGRHSFFRL